jgi:hypothetical protein
MHEPLLVGMNIVDTIKQLGVPDVKQHVLFRDYETRSKLSLKSVGAYRYAAAPSTKVSCCAYAVDDQPVKLWRPGDEVPVEFLEAEWWQQSKHCGC